MGQTFWRHINEGRGERGKNKLYVNSQARTEVMEAGRQIKTVFVVQIK